MAIQVIVRKDGAYFKDGVPSEGTETFTKNKEEAFHTRAVAGVVANLLRENGHDVRVEDAT